jgi:hypothetical protein
MAGARQVVDGPDFTMLPYGLWDALEKRTPNDPHWQNGVTWQEYCPTAANQTFYDACLAVTGTGGSPPSMSSPKLTGNVVSTNRGATVFQVYAEFDCSPVGLDQINAAADVALKKVENRDVEAAFWTGVAGGQTVVWPHLAANAALNDPQGITLQMAATPLVTGGVNAASALGALENQLASCYAGRGYIHVPRTALATLAANKLLDCSQQDQGELYTWAGNRVVVGGGYTGSSPSGGAPATGTSWIYATGQVFGYRSDIFVQQMPGTFDRTENTVHMIATRNYVIGFGCCLTGALVNLGVPSNTST